MDVIRIGLIGPFGDSVRRGEEPAEYRAQAGHDRLAADGRLSSRTPVIVIA
jgi:hypothetical protein